MAGGRRGGLEGKPGRGLVRPVGRLRPRRHSAGPTRWHRPALRSYLGHRELVRPSSTLDYTVMQAWPARYGVTSSLMTAGRGEPADLVVTLLADRPPIEQGEGECNGCERRDGQSHWQGTGFAEDPHNRGDSSADKKLTGTKQRRS